VKELGGKRDGVIENTEKVKKRVAIIYPVLIQSRRKTGNHEIVN